MIKSFDATSDKELGIISVARFAFEWVSPFMVFEPVPVSDLACVITRVIDWLRCCQQRLLGSSADAQALWCDRRPGRR